MTEFFEVREKVVAIVMFGPSDGRTDGWRAGAFYQVTIDPARISPSGKFIRFGGHPGDEIMGWQRCEAMSIVEILGKWQGNQLPELHYGDAGVVPMMSPLMLEMAA